jgi:ATP-dependent exoDNAse (exonuclease V) beta subunit
LAIVSALFGLTEFGQTREQPKPEPDKKKDAQKTDKKKVKELMDLKLEHSQKLLAALVTNDLDKAAKHAEELKRIRKKAAWLIVKTESYETWSKEFTQSADKIIKASKDKNPDAARLGYLEMTNTCFNCHIYVRDLGDISLAGFEK